ncbi:MAG: transporter substrate-binding domain-containing protein, partial [Eubacteriales bacterium]|nr:transporter substrate-binding domain-containing protein [Eubacteriales bacterium]
MKTFQKNRKLMILIAALIIFSSLPIAALAGSDSPEKAVRVGWYTMENFMEGGSGGSAQSGFTYELLCEISAYSHWDIEYVHGSFGELLALLDQGEIDILPNVIDTEERKEKFLFHSLSLNEEHYYISTLNDNVPEDGFELSSLNGKRLVTVQNAFEEKYFDDWASENSVTMEKVYC